MIFELALTLTGGGGVGRVGPIRTTSPIFPQHAVGQNVIFTLTN